GGVLDLPVVDDSGLHPRDHLRGVRHNQVKLFLGAPLKELFKVPFLDLLLLSAGSGDTMVALLCD
ncbi:unnamed protein product, partial [Musa hybrid cultivar]